MIDEHMPDDDAPDNVEVNTIIKRFGSWAVTSYGVECLVRSYPIPFSEIDEDWESHMSHKRWVALGDLVCALSAAREMVAKPGVKNRLRFEVLKRDKYACRLCGRTAAMGAVLAVDHIHPKSRGGSDSIENLWTLCFECNNGKSDLLL